MNYQRAYDALIAKAILVPVAGRVEKHHILPKCIGGTDDASNLVALSPRQHFVAHLLLAKIHPKNVGLLYAAFMMSKRGSIKCSRKYRWVREMYSPVHSERLKSRPVSNKALAAFAAFRSLPKSEAHKQAIAKALTGRKLSEERRKKCAAANLGRKLTQRELELISKRMKGNSFGVGNKSRTGLVNSIETREKISKANTGKRHSEEWKLNISIGQASVSDETVVSVRRDFGCGLSISEISRKHGLSWSNASRIAKRQSYGWVESA